MAVKTTLAFASVLGLLMGPALAQSVVPPAGSKSVIPEKQGAPLQNGRSDSLSKKLSDSDGVIKPHGDIDPGMKTPRPDGDMHTTPVIPPRATGGDNAK